MQWLHLKKNIWKSALSAFMNFKPLWFYLTLVLFLTLAAHRGLPKFSLSAQPKKVSFVQGGLHAEGPWVEVSKWELAQGLEIEFSFSRWEDSGPQVLTQKIQLPWSIDAHMSYQGRLVNLLMVDLDQDGWKEVLVPFFNKNLVARLYVYKYDPFINQFIRQNDEE